MTNNTAITKDISGKKLQVSRPFNAPVEKVWKAWTESELLEKWWAPRPWRAETKRMDFRNGGSWLYSMVGPEGDRHWCRVDFQSIVDGKSFSVKNMFCDEEGTPDPSFPDMNWIVNFLPTETGTTIVDISISFNSEEDLKKIVEMGFETGFSMALGNLDELL